jgi:transposase
MAGKSKYNREFKLALIAQIEAGETATVVARENGLSPTLVARWLREYKQNPEEAFAGPGHPYKQEAKIAELERTVGQLYAENLFLKKTIERFREAAEEEKAKSQYKRGSK